MSLQGLQERLAALQETATQLQELIHRLGTLEFRPGSVPLDADEESSPSGELGVEISQMLRAGLDEQELLLEEARFARPEGHDKARLRDGIERLGSQLVSHRAAFRKARLAARKSLELAQKQERHLLVRSLSIPASGRDSPTSTNGESPVSAVRRPPRHALRQSSLSQQDRQTVGASSNVTAALRRTHDMMAAELSRSEFAHQTLTESSAALKQLNESYSSLDSMLASSRDLLGTLLRSQKSDTWYLQTALYMLMTTAAWLIFRRILYGPLWWLIWLPIRVLFGVGTRAGGAVLRGTGDDAAESANMPAGGQIRRIPVDGLPDDDLPIAQVRYEAKDENEVDLESVIGKIREIVDDGGLPDGQTESKTSSKGESEAEPPDEQPGSTETESQDGQPHPDDVHYTAGQGVAGEGEDVGGQAQVRDEL